MKSSFAALAFLLLVGISGLASAKERGISDAQIKKKIIAASIASYQETVRVRITLRGTEALVDAEARTHEVVGMLRFAFRKT
jgi:hypothetical protein